MIRDWSLNPALRVRGNFPAVKSIPAVPVRRRTPGLLAEKTTSKTPSLRVKPGRLVRREGPQLPVVRRGSTVLKLREKPMVPSVIQTLIPEATGHESSPFSRRLPQTPPPLKEKAPVSKGESDKKD
jgi:hypothetical protein